MKLSPLYGPCPCGKTKTRPYPAGPRCSKHSPAALAGRIEPPTISPDQAAAAREAERRKEAA
ncbi:hypothetical protein HS045_33260 [Planomonospora sp. ID82291]|nr:hypothetical protein [Planomonospora sp. ID82291]